MDTQERERLIRLHKRALTEAKKHLLAKSEGFQPDEFELLLEQRMFDGIQPGICMNPGCEYTTDVEPDQRHGYCEECRTQTVRSLSEL